VWPGCVLRGHLQLSQLVLEAWQAPLSALLQQLLLQQHHLILIHGQHLCKQQQQGERGGNTSAYRAEATEVNSKQQRQYTPRT
jgi:hypothetical protein